MSTTIETIDEARVQEFAGRLFGIYTGAMLSAMIDIGHRTGLFEAAAQGPASSPELARRAGLHERYVREWLGSMASSNIVEYDAASETYRLPPEHAACLTGIGSGNLAPFGQLNTHLATHVAEVARVFRDGGGVPYEAFRPEFTDAMDALGRGAFDEDLIDIWLAVRHRPERNADPRRQSRRRGMRHRPRRRSARARVSPVNVHRIRHRPGRHRASAGGGCRRWCDECSLRSARYRRPHR